MSTVELLAPAGNMQVLEAALAAGADAVYLGMRHFNARAGAANFSPEEFRLAVEKAHARGCKVYVTLNTQLSQQELGMAARSLALAAECGADGVLVTDPAYLFFKRHLPGIPIHFSTQAGLSSSAGVRAARKLGVTRVVLARELSFEEIKAASAVDGIETEVFIQGAMCFSCSGRCLISSWGGGRSGNRGGCTSPCRVLWKNQDGVEARPMSMRDLSLLEWLGALEHVGVASFKIEGRLKSPEWVSSAVSLYRSALDGTRPMEELRAEAVRLGDYTGRDLTDGYLRGATSGMTGESGRLASCGAAPAAAEKPAEAVGSFRVTIKEEDGGGAFLWHFSREGKEALFRTPPQRLPNPRRATTLSNAYKTMQTYCQEKKLPLDPLERFDYFQTKLLSRNAANTVADAFIAFTRTFDKPDDGLPRGIRIPDALRDALAPEGACAENRRTMGMWPDRVRCYVEQLKSLPKEYAGAEKIAVLKSEDVLNPDALMEMLSAAGCRMAALPQVIYEGQIDAYLEVMRRCAAKKVAVEVNSWDTWELASEAGCVMEAGPGLGVMNALAARTLQELGCRCVTISPELDRMQLEHLTRAATTPLSLIVYGAPALMTTRAQLPALFQEHLEDARGLSLHICHDGDLTELRPDSPLDLRSIRNPNVHVAHLVADLCGSPKKGNSTTFNYERRLR